MVRRKKVAKRPAPDSKKHQRKARPVKGQALRPWSVKYLPNDLDGVKHQQEVIEVLKDILTTGNLPHLSITGPRGCGKNALVHTLINTLYSPENRQKRTARFNCYLNTFSDIERKIKHWMKQPLKSGGSRVYRNPSYRILVLEEAEQLSDRCRQHLTLFLSDLHTKRPGLRVIMVWNNYRLHLDGVDSDAQLLPINLQSVPDDFKTEHLKYILESENVIFDDQTIESALVLSQNNLKAAIELLQKTSILYKVEDRKEEKLVVLWSKMSSLVSRSPPSFMSKLYTTIRSHDVDDIMDFVKTDVIRAALDPLEIISWFRLTIELILSGAPSADLGTLTTLQATRIYGILSQRDRELRTQRMDPTLTLQAAFVEISSWIP